MVKYLGHKPWFSKVVRATFPPIDKAMIKLTRGRVVAMGLVPSLTLTTTGKKSGLEREQPLAYTPDGDDVVLIGSNWGGPTHPAWTYNLIANPRAKVCIKGKTFPVTARLLTGAEREEKWKLALEVWPAYATYAKRIDRQIRVFLLIKS